MGAIASQIISPTTVYSTVYSNADERKHQISPSLAFVRGPVNSPHKWPVTRKMFPFDDVSMIWTKSACYITPPNAMHILEFRGRAWCLQWSWKECAQKSTQDIISNGCCDGDANFFEAAGINELTTCLFSACSWSAPKKLTCSSKQRLLPVVEIICAGCNLNFVFFKLLTMIKLRIDLMISCGIVELNITRPHRWLVNIDPGDDLVSKYMNLTIKMPSNEHIFLFISSKWRPFCVCFVCLEILTNLVV